MATRPVHHPVFARLCAAISYRMSPELIAHRRQLLATLSGRVLELGAGDGINFPLTRASSLANRRASLAEAV
jgi:hypothetical protein